jgi:hypothetical protein
MSEDQQLSAYESHSLGLSIQYPSSYKVLKDKPPNGVTFHDPDRSNNIMLSTWTRWIQHENPTLEQMFEELFDNTPEELGAESTSLGGHTAYKYDNLEGPGGPVLEILTSKDNTGYTLSLFHRNGKPLADFTDKVINTFKFI